MAVIRRPVNSRTARRRDKNRLRLPSPTLSGRPPAIMRRVPDAAALPLSLVVLAAALAAAVVRPPRAPEWAVAAGGALLLAALGAVDGGEAVDTAEELAPTIGFLAALLLIAEGCRRDGLFDAIGALLARRAGGSPRRLLALVFAVAAAVTAALSLDATVVLLTPVVLATAARLRTSPSPHVVRLRAPGELRLAAAPGLQPDQPARLPRERPLVPALRGADGAARGSP